MQGDNAFSWDSEGGDRAFVAAMKAARDTAGMSVNEFARIAREEHGLAFHPSTVQRIERGERPLKLHEALVVAKMLGTSVEEMMSGGAEKGILNRAYVQADLVQGIAVRTRALAEECRSVVGAMEALRRDIEKAGDSLGPVSRRVLDGVTGEGGREALSVAAATLDGVVESIGPYGTV